MEQVFEISANHAPGLLARVESIFRRQRTQIRSFFFERGEGREAHLTITAEANGDVAGLLRRQLLRLEDVRDVAEVGQTRAFAPAQSPFIFKEKTA